LPRARSSPSTTIFRDYAEVNRIWKKGDCVEWVMDMPVKLLEANPLAEEIRNQVVVKRGPVVYCLESMDIEGGHKIDNVLIPADRSEEHTSELQSRFDI